MKRIRHRQVSEEADVLNDRVLVDRHLLAAKLHKVTIRVVPELQGRRVNEVGHVRWHGRANTAFKNHINRLAAAVILQRREAKLAKAVFVVDALDSRGGCRIGDVMLSRAPNQVRTLLATAALDHDLIEERLDRG